jgi:hypothetical protein
MPVWYPDHPTPQRSRHTGAFESLVKSLRAASVERGLTPVQSPQDAVLHEVAMMLKTMRKPSPATRSTSRSVDELLLKSERVMARLAAPALPVEIETDPLGTDVPKDPPAPAFFISPLENDAARFTRTASGDFGVKVGKRTYSLDQVLYRCQDAMRDGRVTGAEVVQLETAFHVGAVPDGDVIQRVMSKGKQA